MFYFLLNFWNEVFKIKESVARGSHYINSFEISHITLGKISFMYVYVCMYVCMCNFHYENYTIDNVTSFLKFFEAFKNAFKFCIL